MYSEDDQVPSTPGLQELSGKSIAEYRRAQLATTEPVCTDCIDKQSRCCLESRQIDKVTPLHLCMALWLQLLPQLPCRPRPCTQPHDSMVAAGAAMYSPASPAYIQILRAVKWAE